MEEDEPVKYETDEATPKETFQLPIKKYSSINVICSYKGCLMKPYLSLPDGTWWCEAHFFPEVDKLRVKAGEQPIFKDTIIGKKVYKQEDIDAFF